MTSYVYAHWDPLILHGVNPTGKEIGRGAYGRVFEVDYEGTLCAAKEVHTLLLQYAQGGDLQKIKDDFLSECQIWSTLRHPCVVQFLGVYYPAMDQYRLPVMVMEKMQHSLRGLVENYDKIPLNVKLSILDEVCLGLRYLHSRNPPIVHRDLTPNNILLSHCLEAKISDLGVAKVVRSDNQKTMTKLPGTPDFMPPEALSKRPVYGPSLDVFSYGGVILNVITQLWPEPADRHQFNPDTDIWEVVSEVKRRQQYLDKMTGGTADLKPLVMSCLNENPKKRPTLVQVSTTVKRAKDECSQKSSRDGMSPIVWWAEVTSGQQSQATSLLTTALEEMTINNEQMRREVDVLKSHNDAMKDENKQLKANNDKQRDEIIQLQAKQKDEIRQLTTLLDKMAVNNENQIQQINSQSSENVQLRTEVDMIKAENIQLKIEIDDLRRSATTSEPQPLPRARQQPKQQLLLKESTTPGDLFSGPVNIKWEEGAPAPVGCWNHTAVWLNGLVYVGGGDETGYKSSYIINCYDPVNNSWSSSTNTPHHNFALTTLNNALVTAGGWDRSYKTTNKVLMMDAGQLKDYTKMITARSGTTAAGYQGMLIITGGRDDKDKMLSSTELFDSNNVQWYKCSNLPTPHISLQSVIVDNTLYLLGGFGKNSSNSPAVFTTSLDTLSAHQLKWNTHQDTPWRRSAPVSVNGAHLLIVGGYKDTGGNGKVTSDIHKLNKVSHSWDAIGHIPSARCRSAAVSTADNRVIVIGGQNDKVEVTNTVWIGSCEPQ